MRNFLFITIVCLVFAEDSQAAIINGSFESDLSVGWTTEGTGPYNRQENGVGFFTTPFGPPTNPGDPLHYFEIGSSISDPGVLSQTVNGLTAGQKYDLKFNVNWSNIVGNNFLDVSLGASTFSLSNETSGSNGAAGWKEYVHQFVVSGPSQLLKFQFGTDALMGLDNVSLTPVFSSVPEPSSFSLIGAIGAFGVWRRRRNQRLSAESKC